MAALPTVSTLRCFQTQFVWISIQRIGRKIKQPYGGAFAFDECLGFLSPMRGAGPQRAQLPHDRGSSRNREPEREPRSADEIGEASGAALRRTVKAGASCP